MITSQAEREAAYELKDRLLAVIAEDAPGLTAAARCAAALGTAFVVAEQLRGMTELQVAELAMSAAIDGLPMAEQVVARDAWERYRKP